MGHAEILQETVPAMPIIPRLDRLDRMLQLLEGKHSLSRREFSANILCEKNEEENECKSLCAAVDEVQHKGTIMERLSMIESRLLKLSLEMEEGNTSKSSSSSTRLHIGKESDQNEKELPAITPQETKAQHIPQPKDVDSFSEGEFTTKRRSQQKERRQKKKPNKKWLGLLQFRLKC